MNNDANATWVYGIKEPGWYCARWTWDQEWAKQLESRGYRVMKSVDKPTER